MWIATWNTEWRKAGSADAEIVRQRLRALEPEIVCLTETHTDFLSGWQGFTICGSDDWGGPTHGTRREVLLWSRNRWRDVDVVGSPNLPPGRFVKAITDTSLGEVTVVGVVIPYHMSNVRFGSRDRAMWELHRLYLEALPAVTAGLEPNSIVLGDFNQRIPSKWVPAELREKLRTALPGLNIVTGGLLEPLGAAAIDHIAVGKLFRAEQRQAISNLAAGREISDHFGVAARLALQTSDEQPVVVSE
jgi:endonuclease/exonuclease/phosphatase family metal-dependent hydrolase